MKKSKAKRKYVRKEKPLKEPYEIALLVGGEMYSSSGETMLEALESLPKPHKIVSKAELFIRHGSKQRTMPLIIPHAKRLFYPLGFVIRAKQLELLLK